MAFDLSTPEAQLAFKIAVSAQKTQDAKARLERQARNSVTAQLAPYGQSVDDYDSDFRSIYDPAANRQQAQAQAMQRYVTGLPELLDRVRKEQTANSRGSGSGASGQIPFVSSGDFNAKDYMDYLISLTTPKTPVYGSQPGYNVSPIFRPGFKPPSTGAVQPRFQRQINADRFG
jgi:hypothetical protein